jgi:hypothetical protein
MSLYEATKGQTRPVHLEQLCRSLKSIKPSSIDPERGFSAMGYFCTKIRSRMGDDQGDCREEARRAHKIPISAQNGPFGQPGR